LATCENCCPRSNRSLLRSPRSIAAHTCHSHKPSRLCSRLLCRFRHDGRSRSQDGAAMDHDRTRRALPHTHHSSLEESHRRRRPRRHHKGRRLERRRRVSLLPAGAFATRCFDARSTSSTSRRSTPKCAAENRLASSGSPNTSVRATSITSRG
jgi:hypothetical protein